MENLEIAIYHKWLYTMADRPTYLVQFKAIFLIAVTPPLFYLKILLNQPHPQKRRISLTLKKPKSNTPKGETSTRTKMMTKKINHLLTLLKKIKFLNPIKK